MRTTQNRYEVNVFLVTENNAGEIIDSILVATFINEAFAIEFVKACNAKYNYNEYKHLDMRVNYPKYL